MSTDKYVIHLTKCALKNKNPKEKPENLSWNEIFSLADKHMIVNMLWYSVNKLTEKPAPELWKKWTEIKNKAVVKDIIQRSEYQKIINAFEKKHIRCMAVKGIFMKKLYPASDYRTMSDIDILIDEKNADRAGNIMFSLGYNCRRAGTFHHDEYFKVPVMDVEIHRQLFSDFAVNNFSQYYKNVFTKAEKISGTDFVYKMTDEEFYIYTLAHFYKHYSEDGSGIRSVMDIYILNHSIYPKLDKQSLNRKLKKLKLLKFRNEITDLSEMWFGKNKATPELLKLSDYIIGSGTYGTISNRINNNIKSKGKFGYFIYSAFLPLSVMKAKYPVLKKVPVLLPVLWLWRWISAVFTQRDLIILKLKAIF